MHYWKYGHNPLPRVINREAPPAGIASIELKELRAERPPVYQIFAVPSDNRSSSLLNKRPTMARVLSNFFARPKKAWPASRHKRRLVVWQPGSRGFSSYGHELHWG